MLFYVLIKTDTAVLYPFLKINTFTYKSIKRKLGKMIHYVFLIKIILYSIKNIEELESLNEIILLQIEVSEVQLQDKLGEENFHQNGKNFNEPLTNAIKNTSENLAKTITETSIQNNQTL